MENYSRFKTGLVAFKVSLLSILMMAVGSIEAVCVSIDTYTAPNGRKIYLFGDIHIDTRERRQQEQDAFIAAAQQKGACCIVEDMEGYAGDNLLIKRCIEAIQSKKMFYGDDIFKYPVTALVGITKRCSDLGIACFNAEYRQALNLINLKSFKSVGLKLLAEDIDKMVDEVRGYNDGSLSDDDFMSHFKVGDNIDGAAACTVKSVSDTLSFDQMLKISMKLFDARVIHRLYQLLSDRNDQRDIFIFAGADHIRFIGKQLYLQLGFNKACYVHDLPYFDFLNSFEFDVDGKKFFYKHSGIDRMGTQLIMDYSALNIREKLNQEMVHAFVIQYEVDIAHYFKTEAGLERLVSQSKIGCAYDMKEVKHRFLTWWLENKAHIMCEMQSSQSCMFTGKFVAK